MMRIPSSASTGRIMRRHHAVTSVKDFSGFTTMAENQINAWLRKGGDKDIDSSSQHKKALDGDRDRRLSNALGVGADYVHSKILADNNIKPESIQRRLDLDKSWNTLQLRIQEAYSTTSGGRSVDEFCTSRLARALFQEQIQALDQQAKAVNEAIISDSMRFNGRSPVPHARPFRLEERLREALKQHDIAVTTGQGVRE